MKPVAAVLCLLLSACGMIPGLSSGDSSSSAAPAAPTTTTVSSSTATAGAAVATAIADPSAATVANAASAVAGAASAAGAATGLTTGLAGTSTVTFDSSKKLEYVDLYVDMGDPAGQRALVPYLLKPKDWMLVGCDMTSLASKHYRFMRVSTADGKALPEVDIFKGR